MAKKTGRPRILDDAIRARIIEILEIGGSRNLAARIVGCATTTIQNEAKRNRPFLDALRKAEGDCELHHIKRIRDGEKTWCSSAWFLERKWPGRYSKREAPPPPSPSVEEIKIRAVIRKMAQEPTPDADINAG